MIKKHYIIGLLVLSIFATSFLPAFAPRAKALLGGFGGIVFDPIHNASTIFQTTLTLADMIARAVAQAILQRMIDSTVDWANNGFEGNPAYVTDPKSFFRDLSDRVAGELIAGSDLNFLCSPFQDQVRLSLYYEHLDPSLSDDPFRYQCTATDILNNIDNAMSVDDWFYITQNDVNNPYGAYLKAQIELENRREIALGRQQEQLRWNSGFLNIADCLRRDPNGQCAEFGPTRTPGSIIAGQLNQVLPSTMNRFINAQHLEDLIAAFVTGALNRYVFSSTDGLFSSAPPPARVPPLPPPPISGSGGIQACMTTCMNLYCPTGNPNDASCNTVALGRCIDNCSGFNNPTPGPGPGFPVVTLNAERIVVPLFTFASLDWTSTNATSCAASGGWSGVKALTGNETVRVTDPIMTFVLTCSNANGATSASVSVQR